jgi:competence protein ComEC
MISAAVPLRANVLVASHHGRKSGFHEAAMDLISPEVVIISTASLPKKDDATELYRARGARVYSTREHGTITVRMHDNGDIQVFDETHDGLLALHDAA